MTRSLPAPKFRRLRCTECGRVVPWQWFNDRRATMTVDAKGKVSAKCNNHAAGPEAGAEAAGDHTTQADGVS